MVKSEVRGVQTPTRQSAANFESLGPLVDTSDTTDQCHARQCVGEETGVPLPL